MKVELISYSQSHAGAGTSASEAGASILDLICYCARVSNPSNQCNTENNEKLAKYLIKNHHWSPFEMATICLEIETTRDIARQILRHRSFSFQEFSQRYAVADIGVELKETRMQDAKNRQSSTLCQDPSLAAEWERQQERVIRASLEVYQWALDNDIAKEQARAVLPEGNTVSRLYMNGTLRSWIHYIQLRSGNGTQLEHQQVAIECAVAISKVFPMITDFLQ